MHKFFPVLAVFLFFVFILSQFIAYFVLDPNYNYTEDFERLIRNSYLFLSVSLILLLVSDEGRSLRPVVSQPFKIIMALIIKIHKALKTSIIDDYKYKNLYIIFDKLLFFLIQSKKFLKKYESINLDLLIDSKIESLQGRQQIIKAINEAHLIPDFNKSNYFQFKFKAKCYFEKLDDYDNLIKLSDETIDSLKKHDVIEKDKFLFLRRIYVELQEFIFKVVNAIFIGSINVKIISEEIDAIDTKVLAYTMKALSFEKLERYSDSLDSINAASNLSSHPDYTFFKGKVYFKIHEIGKSRNEFDKFIDSSDDYVQACKRVSMFFQNNNEFDIAEYYLGKRIERSNVRLFQSLMNSFRKRSYISTPEVSDSTIYHESLENRKNLFQANARLRAESVRRIKAEDRMSKMVAQYTHTLGNTLFPETIYKVSEALKDHAEFRRDSLVLRSAYHAEVLVRHQAELLRLVHGSEDASEFQRYIFRDRLQEDSTEAAVNVLEILNYAAERVVARLLNQNYPKLQTVRQQLVEKSGMKLDTLRSDFEEEVFFEDKQTALEWMDAKLAKTRIGELSPSWQKVRLRKDGYAHALLQGHWGELLFNVFKYAEHTQPEFLKLTFEEHMANDQTWLRMIWENPCASSEEDEFGKGLEGIAVHLYKLNETEDEGFTLNSSFQDQCFQVSLNYRSDHLVPYQLNPDLVKNYYQKKRSAQEVV